MTINFQAQTIVIASHKREENGNLCDGEIQMCIIIFFGLLTVTLFLEINSPWNEGIGNKRNVN